MQNPRGIKVNAPRTLNITYARVLISHLLQRKPNALALLAPEHSSYLAQNDPLARCSLHAWHTLMNTAERHLGSRDLVPELAEQFKPWHAGLLGFTLMTSGSVLELADLLKRFHHLLNDVFFVTSGVANEQFFLRLETSTAEQSPRLARFSLSVWAQRLRWLTGQADLKLDVSFEGPPPDDIAPYRRIFRGTVRFDQDSNTMWGPAACRVMPIVSHDTASHSLLQNQALKQLELLSHSDEQFIDKLQGLIRARLPVGKVALEDIAAELKLQPRTLQRRLEEIGLNFRLMIDDMRKSEAEHHLRDGQMSLAELASTLGFADHASFNRAFKRWTGSSPGAFRRAQVQA